MFSVQRSAFSLPPPQGNIVAPISEGNNETRERREMLKRGKEEAPDGATTNEGETPAAAPAAAGNIVSPVSVGDNVTAPESGPGGSGFGFRSKAPWEF